jgi:hypothetical protein
MNGISTESKMYNLYTNIYKEFDLNSEELIKKAKLFINVEKWCISNRKRLGKNRLEDFNSRFILDHLYKLDIVINLGKSNLGIQITIDDTSVDEKLRTLNRYKQKGLYQAIGLDQVMLVVIKSNYENRLWSKEEVEDSIFDSVDFAYDSKEVRVFTLTIPD